MLHRVLSKRLVSKIKLPNDSLKFVCLNALDCNVEYIIFSVALIN